MIKNYEYENMKLIEFIKMMINVTKMTQTYATNINDDNDENR